MPRLPTERRTNGTFSIDPAQRWWWMALGPAIALLSFAAVTSCSSPYQAVPRAAPRAYTEGEDALARGEYENASSHFSAYLASGRITYRARALYQLARAQYNLEDYTGAEASLARLNDEFPGFGRKQVNALRGDLAYATGNRLDAILLWESAYEKSSADEREVLRPRIEEAIRFLDADEARELAGVATNPQIYELALRRIDSPGAFAALQDGTDRPPDVGGSEREAILSDRSPPEVSTVGGAADPRAGAPAPPVALKGVPSDEKPPAPVDKELDELGSDDVAPPVAIAALPGGEATAGEPGVYIGPRVAALLPLTGSGRAEGARALAALRRSMNAATLLIRDTGSDPAIAVELVKAMTADRDVVALLGPMLAAEIDAVSSAPTSDLPILPLRDRLQTNAGPDPIAALAAHAVRVLHVKRFGILSPSIDRGTPFAQAVSALGATVAGTLLYDSDEPNTDAVLAAVQSWIDAGGIDAVYIPDEAGRATRIGVAARSVAPRLVLLGDSGWNDTTALAAAGPAVDGAVIAAGPPPSGDLEDTVVRVAAALQRAIALGESDRTRTKPLIDAFAEGASSPSLFQVVGGRPVPVP